MDMAGIQLIGPQSLENSAVVANIVGSEQPPALTAWLPYGVSSVFATPDRILQAAMVPRVFERENGIGGLTEFREFQGAGSIGVPRQPVVSRRANLPDPAQPANFESSDVL
jgi:hypothetical protein